MGLGPTEGSEVKTTRPCMIVGSEVLNQRRNTLVVIPLSTGPPAAPPLAIVIPSVGERAVTVMDQIRAAVKQRLIRRVGAVSSAELAAVESGLRAISELETLTNRSAEARWRWKG